MGRIINLGAAADGAPVAQRYRIEVLGPFAFYRDGSPVDTSTWRPRALTLIRLLAVAPGLRRPRDEVIDLLWPDAEPEAGSANLRDLVRLVRKGLDDGSSPVALGQGWVALNPAYRWEVDLARFEELVEEAGDDLARLEEAASLPRGKPLLGGRYADWAGPIRERVERRWRQTCLKLIERYRALGAGERALAWAERLLAHDPLDEVALRQALMLLDELGRRKEAERHYRQFADRLARELDVAISLETEALIERIRRLDVHAEQSQATFLKHTPPEATPSSTAANLPVEVTSFIGRDREIAAVSALLRRDDVHLVTLSGPGGTGKTRLAVHVAGEVADAFPEGVWFVPLASVADPEHVASTVAATLGLKAPGGMPVAAAVAQYLRPRKALLVLDNYEHLRPAAPFVAELVAQCPALRVVVTSRAVLQLSAEHQYEVPPLPAPDPERLGDGEALVRQDAVALFVDRARAVRAGFTLNETNAAAVSAICRRLEGLPLAIELAAARARIFPPAALLSRLDQRLALLTGGARDLPARQQTLRATVDWSYNLLTGAERALFARLSVFAGGCTPEAAEAVCAGGDCDAVDGLASLVEQSLLRSEGEAEPRFGMLETIREYARERLAASGETAAVQERHAAHFLQWAREAYQGSMGPDQVLWLDRQEREHDNLRAALTWFYEMGDMERACIMAVALQCLWLDRCHHAEAAIWFSRLVAAAGQVSKPVRARLLLSARWFTGRPQDVEEALRLYRELDDLAGCASVLCGLADLALHRGESARGVALASEALALARRAADRREGAGSLQPPPSPAVAPVEHGTDQWEIGESLQLLGIALLHEGQPGRALSALDESLAIFRVVGNLGMLAWTAHWVSLAAFLVGDHALATRLGEETLRIETDLGNTFAITTATWVLGLARLEQGDLERAALLLREGLLQLRADFTDGPQHLGALGALAAQSGQPARAARLLGAFDAARERGDQLSLPAPLVAYFRGCEAVVRAQLGEPGWTAAWAEGRAMTAQQALGYALEEGHLLPSR